MTSVDPLLAPMASLPHIIGPKEGRTSLAPARDDREPDPGARYSRAGILIPAGMDDAPLSTRSMHQTQWPCRPRIDPNPNPGGRGPEFSIAPGSAGPSPASRD